MWRRCSWETWNWPDEGRTLKRVGQVFILKCRWSLNFSLFSLDLWRGRSCVVSVFRNVHEVRTFRCHVFILFYFWVKFINWLLLLVKNLNPAIEPTNTFFFLCFNLSSALATSSCSPLIFPAMKLPPRSFATFDLSENLTVVTLKHHLILNRTICKARRPWVTPPESAFAYECRFRDAKVG